MTAIELIKETVAFYEEDPSRRALEEGSCEYETKDGRCCAVGRCIKPEKRKGLMMAWDRVSYRCAPSLSAEQKQDILLEKYQGFPDELWTDLQRWHDTRDNWEKTIMNDDDFDAYRAEHTKILLTRWEGK